MNRQPYLVRCALLAAGTLLVRFPPAAHAQSAPKTVSTDSASAVEHGLALAQQGRCREALPLLKKAGRSAADNKLIFRATMTTARCAMSLDQVGMALEALTTLNRDYPRDPEVLYLSTHYYSELATRAAQELAAIAPDSAEAHELDAEALESQNKWEDATAEYKGILERNPEMPGIHYRLGRILLSKPATPGADQEAKKEMDAELAIDPRNAAAEFILGEIERRAEHWEAALPHFSRASQIDVGFSEAYLAMGMCLNALSRYGDAVPPLEKYEKLQPSDAAGHYQLAIAYQRTGRKQDAAREMELQRQSPEKAPE
jgi:tetratricopeptide (TPR) repeat protein